MRVWKVTCRVGVYWDGGEYLVGVFRWNWLAFLFAKLHLMKYPYRQCHIVPISRFHDDWSRLGASDE
jgi:hypothetical protein